MEFISDQVKLKKQKLKELGIEARQIPKSLATTLAIIFSEEKYPKNKIED